MRLHKIIIINKNQLSILPFRAHVFANVKNQYHTVLPDPQYKFKRNKLSNIPQHSLAATCIS